MWVHSCIGYYCQVKLDKECNYDEDSNKLLKGGGIKMAVYETFIVNDITELKDGEEQVMEIRDTENIPLSRYW